MRQLRLKARSGLLLGYRSGHLAATVGMLARASHAFQDCGSLSKSGFERRDVRPLPMSGLAGEALLSNPEWGAAKMAKESERRSTDLIMLIMGS